jgi:hypothetical protein
MFFRSAAVTALLACSLSAQPADPRIAALARYADAFRDKARRVISEETLTQRSYTLPPHSHFAIGAAAGPLFAQFFVHEIVSEFTVGTLAGDRSGALLEVREILSKDGAPVQTPLAARKALRMDISAGVDRMRKKLLAEFTALGLVDVATDYGLILLAFSREGMADVVLEEVGSAWVGTDEAVVFDWRQTRGGVLEWRGNKASRRPMSGRVWIRRSDNLPLRVTASIGHGEPGHDLRDDAAVDFVPTPFGCAMPASVVHRHFVDGKLLTENLYTYGRFRLFSTDTTVEFGTPIGKR